MWAGCCVTLRCTMRYVYLLHTTEKSGSRCLPASPPHSAAPEPPPLPLGPGWAYGLCVIGRYYGRLRLQYGRLQVASLRPTPACLLQPGWAGHCNLPRMHAASCDGPRPPACPGFYTGGAFLCKAHEGVRVGACAPVGTRPHSSAAAQPLAASRCACSRYHLPITHR